MQANFWINTLFTDNSIWICLLLVFMYILAIIPTLSGGILSLAFNGGRGIEHLLTCAFKSSVCENLSGRSIKISLGNEQVQF